MTTADKTTQHTPRAADSGASATDHFLADRATDGAADIPQERIDALARASSTASMTPSAGTR